MSYCSENLLPLDTPIRRLKEVIDLLGYRKVRNPFKTENLIGSYIWMGNDDSISFVELELNIYRHEDCISVQTRTRIGRSFWDLQWQNKTISLLKALFGGTFITDEGKNKLFPICSPEPSKIQCSLYLAKWVFDNDIMKISLSVNSGMKNPFVQQNRATGGEDKKLDLI